MEPGPIADMGTVASQLPAWRGLQCLVMHNCMVDDAAAAILAAALPDCKQLALLDLSKNMVEDAGAHSYESALHPIASFVRAWALS